MSINFLRKGGANTSDATATADDILSPKTAYVNGNKIVGSILPTYENVDATEYLSTNLNFSTSDKYSKLLQLGSYVFYMGYDSNTGNINLISINGNKAESKQSFTVKELFDNTSVGGILLSYDSYTDNEEYTLCPGIGYNNGGGTTFVYFRRIKYNVKSRKFEIIDGIANSSWASNGNNYGYSAASTSNIPNRVLVQYSTWNERMNLAYCKIIWSENSGNISTILTKTGIYQYGIKETGNDYMFTVNGQLYVIDNQESEFSKSDSINYPVYISHNCKYMIYNNGLYSCNISNDANEIINGKELIQNGLPSYTNVYFSKDDTYAILVGSSAINIIKFDDKGYTIIQSINTNSKVFAFNSTMFLCLISNLWHKYEYTTGKELVDLSVKGQLLIKAKASNVPLAEQVLKDKTFIGLNGVSKGTMANNGELVYTPSDEEQIIPNGYTSGGKITATDITKLTKYKIYDKLTDCIIDSNLSPYLELEYIQCSGKQYIDTKYKPNAKTNVELDVNIVSYSGSTEILYGSRTGYCNNEYSFWHWYSEYAPGMVIGRGSNAETRTKYTWTNQKVKIKQIGSNFKIIKDNSTVYNNNYSTSGSFNSNAKTLKIFAFDSENGIINYTKNAKLYAFKIYEDNTLIKDFVPVLNIFTNEIGLYDKMSNEFFANKGTGSFISGGAV